MSKRTPVYSLNFMEIGDILFPGYDQENMETVDRQLSSLIRFVGPGVLSGWTVTSLKRPTDTDSTFGTIMLKREALANATIASNSEFYQLYASFGSPKVNRDGATPEDETIWSRIIVVSSGNGIVGLYSAKTTKDAYLLLPLTQVLSQFVVWAQPSICLVTEGLCVIGYTDASDDTIEYTSQTCTYLATINLSYVDSDYIADIEYTTDRKDLNNLASALLDSLNKYYYRHIHAGLPTHPSKIQLSTEKILIASVPSDYESTPFFYITDEEGSPFTWKTSDYGVTTVYLNNEIIPSTDYTIDNVLGIIYLKNSLTLNSFIQIILPLRVEVELIAKDITSVNYIELVNSSNTLVVWDDKKYEIPIVTFKNIVVSSDNYEIISSLGRIYFVVGAITVNSATVNSDLVVKISALKKEITGTLSGARIDNIDASSFKRGTLTTDRFRQLDHVGQVRFKEKSELLPYLRLFDQGDHYTFYPEVTTSNLEYNAHINTIYTSAVIKKTLIGTKNGLYQTTDFSEVIPVSSWTTDMGIPKFITDNVFNANQIYFKNTYVLTEEGTIYYTSNKMVSWNKLKLPRIPLYGNQTITPKITSLVVSTNSTNGEHGLKYQTVYYIGTESNGLFKAIINTDQADNEWQWARVHLDSYNEFESINSLCEISTLKTVVMPDLTILTTERSVYIGTPNGLYVSLSEAEPCKQINIAGIDFTGDNYIKYMYSIKAGDGPNNIIWQTNQKTYFTRDAVEITINGGTDRVTTYWIHPMSQYFSLDVDIVDSQIMAVDVSTNSDNDISLISATLPTITTTRVGSEGGKNVLNGVELTNITKVLFTNFEDSEHNGVYTYTSSASGSSVFTIDATFINNKIQSDLFVVESNSLANNLWHLSAITGGIVGTDALSFSPIWISPINLSHEILNVDLVTDVSDSNITVVSFDENTNTLIVSSDIVDLVPIPNQTIVLFTHFTNSLSESNKKYNGIYKYIGGNAFVRTADMFLSSDLVRTKYIKSDAGNYWLFSGMNNPSINISDISITQVLHPFTPQAETTCMGVYEDTCNLEYWLLSTSEIYAIKNYKTDDVWNVASVYGKNWKTYSQYIPNCLIDLNNNKVVVGSESGLWVSENSGGSWGRTNIEYTYSGEDSIINSIPIPTIYNSKTGAIVTGWFIDYISQSFVFYSSQPLWSSYIYERDYTDYYISPWTPLSDVIIYENEQPINVAYNLDPTLGKITFATSRNLDSSIKVTIIRQGAFISNVGINAHEELQNVLIVQDSPVTSLSQDLIPGANVIVVKDKTTIPTTTEYIELRLGASASQTRERINIHIDSDGNINIISPRTNTITFTKDYTTVYLAEIGVATGIEDKLSLYNSNQTYHFNSLTGVNTLQLAMSAREQIPSLSGWDMNDTLFLGSSDLGLTSQSKPYTGFDPPSRSYTIIPTAYYSNYSASVSGTNMQVFTDSGVWKIINGIWDQESTLDDATAVYFVENINNVLVCGSNTGLWQYDALSWVRNPLYKTTLYDYLDTDWFGGQCWVYAKNDGVAFVWREKGKVTFKSDSFNLVNGINVYGLYKSYFIRIDKNGKQSKYDVVYLLTESGLFGVTNGIRTGEYASFLAGRELFGDALLTITATGVPVKIYKVVQSGRNLEFKPIILMTNNGLYIVRNWRWTDPINIGINFASESHSLDGLSCYSHLNTTATETLPSATITVYKMFMGTNKGVYRSYDDGYTWEPCERMTTRDLTIYDLTSYYNLSNEIVILASTNDGLYTSVDDGDNWLKTGLSNPNAIYPAIT